MIYQTAGWELNSRGLISINAGLDGYFVCCSTVMQGNLAPGAGNENRSNWLNQLDVPLKSFAAGRQIHGSQIFYNKKRKSQSDNIPDGGRLLDGYDGIINDPDGVSGVFTADCLPLFMYDVQTGLSASIHSGWRGTKDGIASKAVRVMAALGASVDRMKVITGPSMLSCCYQVGHEFKSWADSKTLSMRHGNLYFDNQAAVFLQLQNEGIDPANIFASRYCTGCNSHLFYSWRRSGVKAGRQFSIILKK